MNTDTKNSIISMINHLGSDNTKSGAPTIGKIMGVIKDNKSETSYYTVNISNKIPGILPCNEIKNLKEGDSVSVVIMNKIAIRNVSYVLLSHKLALEEECINDLRKNYLKTYKKISGIIRKYSGNFYIVDIVDGKLTGKYVTNKVLNPGDTVELFVYRIHKNNHKYHKFNIQLSESSYSPISVQKRDVVKCRITKMHYPYAYVEIIGLEKSMLSVTCVIPFTDLDRHKAITALMNSYSVGDEIEAQVLEINRTTVILSATTLQDKTWKQESVAQYLGSEFEAVVEEVQHDAKYIKLLTKDNLQCYMDFFEMCWSISQQEAILSDIKKGDMMEVKGYDLNYDRRCIFVSSKHKHTNSFELLKAKQLIGTTIEAKVIKKDNSVILEYQGMDCILYIEKLHYNREKSRRIFNNLNIGDTLEVSVYSIQKHRQQLLVTRIPMINDGFAKLAKQLKIDEYYLCKPLKVFRRDNVVAIEPISHIVDDKEHPIDIDSQDKKMYCFVSTDDVMQVAGSLYNLDNIKMKCKLVNINYYYGRIKFSAAQFNRDVDKVVEKSSDDTIEVSFSSAYDFASLDEDIFNNK